MKHLFEQLPLKHLRRRAVAQHPALVEQQGGVRELSRQVQFVAYQHHGVLLLARQLPHQPQQLHLEADVQVQRRLVQQQQFRLLRQRPRQNHALLFSAREFLHQALAQVGGAGGDQGLARNLHIAGAFKPQQPHVDVSPLQHERQHPDGKQQRAFLLHHGDAPRPLPPGQGSHRPTVQQHGPAFRRQQPGQQLQQRGLARGVGPDDGQQLAAADGEVHRLEPKLPVAERDSPRFQRHRCGLPMRGQLGCHLLSFVLGRLFRRRSLRGNGRAQPRTPQ